MRILLVWTAAALASLLLGCPERAPEDGCSKDSDCKGDRICVDGACVAPGGADAAVDASGVDRSSSFDASGIDRAATDSATTDQNIVVESGPRIESVVMNPQVLGPGGLMNLSIVVSDPDGASDITGGRLVDVPSGGVYETFSAPVGSGTVAQYQYYLDWDDIDAFVPITFPPGGGSRQVDLIFVDQAGHEGRQRLTIPLQCGDAALAMCSDGQCVDFATSDVHCGRCDNPVMQGGTCENGVPGCYNSYNDALCSGICTNTDYDVANCGSCGTSCRAWADGHGLPADSSTRETMCYTFCQFQFKDVTERRTCSDFCGDYGLRCLPTDYCAYGQCDAAAYYKQDGYEIECFINGYEEMDCSTLPPATGTCAGGYNNPATFWYMWCLCY
jgi:hypothetical protein